MPMEEEPTVGAVYEDADGMAFEILAVNEDDGTIEIQYEDGSVDELDVDTWHELDLQPLKTGKWKEAEEEDEPETEATKEEKRPPAQDEEDDDELDDYDDSEEDNQDET